jgi:hypothetical protein
MKGTMLVFDPALIEPKVTAYRSAPDLLDLKNAIGGGYLEKVPMFTSIVHAGVLHDCVALCDEDGKSKGLPFNAIATARWEAACRREPAYAHLLGMKTLLGNDYLVGPVVVLYGDRDFMGDL